jgi:hypothetical protein
MPRYCVTVCFTNYTYYDVYVDAPDRNHIDEAAAIKLASEREFPDNIEGGDGGEITEVQEV